MPPIRSAQNSPAAAPSMQNTPRVSSLPSDWRDAPSVVAGGQLGNSSQAGPMQPASNMNQSASNNGQGNPVAQRQVNSLQSRYNPQSPVQPTGFNQPIQRSQANIELAKSLMARYAIDNFSGGLPGEPIKLVDILRQPISTQQRQPLVHQYWETYYDWASLVASQQYEQWLKRIPATGSQADKAMLEAARVVAGNKVLATEIQLGKSQSGLVQYMPNRSSELLPLPNDLPLIQKYKTNYELYRSHRLMPASLRGIDQMLPKTLDLIVRRAEAVRVAKGAADQMIAALSQRQTTFASALEAGRIWRSAEQDMVASVTGYNQAIANYSLTVSQGYQTPEQIVAMLIAKPASNGNIRQGLQNTAQNNNAGQAPSVANNRFINQTQNQVQSNGGSQNPVGGQRDNFGQQSILSNQPRQLSNGNSAGAGGGFNLNAKSAFQPNGQNNTGGQPSNGQRQSVSGQFIAPATPVGNPSNSSFGSYGPQLPTQRSAGQQGNSRSAQAPFGPGANGFGR
jgi:hypothetical protein